MTRNVAKPVRPVSDLRQRAVRARDAAGRFIPCKPESGSAEHVTSAGEDDKELLELGRQFGPAAVRDLEVCRVANEMDKRDGRAPPEVESEFKAAAEAAQALAYRIADLPAHTAAGIRTKLRALAHYNPALFCAHLPRYPDPDQSLAFSLSKDLERTAAEDSEGPVTADSIAPLMFEALELDTPLRSPKEWVSLFAGHALGMHIADKTIRMGKPELVRFIQDAIARSDGVDEIMLKAMDAAQETLDGWSKVLAAAGIRYLVAAAAAAVEADAAHFRSEA